MATSSSIFGEVTLKTINPVSFTHHGVEGLPLMTRGVDGEGKHLRTVYLPASQFRGRIRHEAAIAELTRGSKAQLSDVYMLALGQDLKPEEDAEPEQIRLAEQEAARDASPILDLFGTWKISSRLMVSHLLPEANVRPDKFSIIRRDVDSNDDIMAMLEPDVVDEMYDRRDRQSDASIVGKQIKVATRELGAARKAKNAALVDELEAKILELRLKKTETKGDDESENTKHLVEIEAIPAGVTLTGKLVIQRPKPRDLQILVDAFERFSLKPVTGAQLARGCGEVDGRITFTNGEGEVLLVIAFGGYTAARVDWTDAGKALASGFPTAA